MKGAARALQEFAAWAEQWVERLRLHCSAEALEDALADSMLFILNPKPPGYYPRCSPTRTGQAYAAVVAVPHRLARRDLVPLDARRRQV